MEFEFPRLIAPGLRCRPCLAGSLEEQNALQAEGPEVEEVKNRHSTNACLFQQESQHTCFVNSNGCLACHLRPAALRT